jgi:glycosyltransferase involved in cell wall biosynthesis
MDVVGMKFSLITCTHNPNSIVFNRLIDAIKRLKLSVKFSAEWVVVDNNSNPTISEQFSFDDFNIPVKVVQERIPGLTSARIAGIKSSGGEWIVFFDDDNEPNDDYLINLKKIIEENLDVMCWGAGNINVEFVSEVKDCWIKRNKEIFQERHLVDVIIKKDIDGLMPVGTGLAIKRAVLNDYLKKVDSGVYLLTDRCNSSLMSGGDMQIVYNTIKNGGYIGIGPILRLNHLISMKKSNFKYVKKLRYWTESSHVMVLREVFPEMEKSLMKFDGEWVIFQKTLLKIYFLLRAGKKSVRDIIYDLFGLWGQVNARYVAFSKKKPIFLKIIEKFFIR